MNEVTPAADLPGRPSREGLGRAAAVGVSWNAAAQLLGQAVLFVRIIVLSRLLTPGDFGTFALLALALTLATLLSESGLSVALVQKLDLDERHLNTVFWLQLGLTVVSGATLAGLGPVLARFFGHRELTGFCLALGAAVALTTWGTVHMALLQRELRFRAVALRDLAGAVAGLGVAIVVAVWLHNAWALVASAITTLAVTNLSAVGVVRWRPRLQFDRGIAREILGFSTSILGVDLVSSVVRNGDNVLVGRFLGTTALGLYSRGYQVLLFPIRQVSGVIGRVMFPALAAIQLEHDRVRGGYLRAISGIALVTFPLLAGVLVSAPEMVRVVFGNQWLAAIPIMRVFAVAGVVEAITATSGWLYQSQGRGGLMLMMSVGSAIVLLSCIGIGVALGTPLAVAALFLVALGISVYPVTRGAWGLIGLRGREVLRRVAPEAMCATAMAGVVAAVRLAVIRHGPFVTMGTDAVAGGITYVGLVVGFRLSSARDLVGALRRS